MSFFSALGISKLFGGTALTDEERADLVQEVMLKTLARAAASDTNIKSVEIDKVQGSDDRVSEMEQDFFNMVVKALDVPASSL